MLRAGVEPAHHGGYSILSRARLPVPPPEQGVLATTSEVVQVGARRGEVLIPNDPEVVALVSNQARPWPVTPPWVVRAVLAGVEPAASALTTRRALLAAP